MACYFLFIRLDNDSNIQVGKKGLYRFLRGFYVYVGKAQRGILERLQRHLRQQKRKHWHIDFLLEVGKVEEIVIFEGNEECFLATFLFQHPCIQHGVPGFGSSDCSCRSHLFYLGTAFSFEGFLPVLQVIPFSSWVIWCSEEGLHHSGVANGVVPKTVIEHEKNGFGFL
ncbi:MAG: GIY-YIG nuclease family protein [Atribacterota bacterium]|nr:GIY-YIG nuclease family protein [Atribacterota bacterium]